MGHSPPTPGPIIAPLGPLALSLSGGGYRAAAYHLGTLDLLHRLGLLESVHAISTVSGGTITGCAYALALSRHQAFPAYFEWLYQYLKRTNVIEQVLAGTPAHRGRRSGRRTLITGAADVYASPDFLGASTLGQLFERSGHLAELTFNATEFHSGNAFRFQSSQTGIIGNTKLRVPASVGRHIRLADITAASSCFPGGFEPIAFPEDFIWPREMLESNRLGGQLARLPPSIALMDGGIYDNQGIESLLHSEKRSGLSYTYIVSDTDQRPVSSYFEMPPPTGWRGPTVGTLVLGGLGLAAGALLSGLASLAHLWAQRSGAGLSLLDLLRLFPILLALAVPVVFTYAWRSLRRALAAYYPGKLENLWGFLRCLRCGELIDHLGLRARSLLAMTSSIFMKRVRALGYHLLFADDRFQHRRIATLIYELQREEAPTGELDDSLRSVAGATGGAARRRRFTSVNSVVPSEAQKALARFAHGMPTTLWFTEASQLPALVACGQNTLTFNLLRHLLRLERLAEKNHRTKEEDVWLQRLRSPETQELLRKLEDTWTVLQEDPLHFLPAGEKALTAPVLRSRSGGAYEISAARTASSVAEGEAA